MTSVCFNLYWITSYLFVSKVKVIMPKITLDILNKVLIKYPDFSELLTNLSGDLVKDLKKRENLTKTIRKDIFYRLVVYDLVRFTVINKL